MPRDLTALSNTTSAGMALDRRAVQRLQSIVWPADDPAIRRRLVVTVALLLGAALLNALVPLLFARAVDQFAATGTDAVLAAVPIGLLAAYVLLGWGGKLMNELRWALYGPIEQRLGRRLALRSLEHLHGLSLGFHLDRRTGQLGRVMDNGLSGLRELLFDAVFLILPLLAEVIFVGVILWLAVDAVFAGVLLATIVVYAVILVVGSEWLREHQRRAVRESSAAQGRAIDSLLNYETVKYFGNERHIAERYDQSLALVERLTVKALSLRAVTGIVLVTTLAIGTGTILVLAAFRVSAAEMTIGTFVLVNAYLLQLTRPMDRLGQLYRSIKQAFVDLEQLMHILEEAPEVGDRPDARPLTVGRGEVCFAAVGFAYRGDRPILDGIDFTIRPGETVALVGPTGAGKSTVARLLFRFWDPTAGRITIDGQDLRGVTQQSLREAIAVVPQDTVLFNDTIGYNIAFGRPEASEAEIEAAAEAAELHPFIMALPDRYATLVGERGLKLSGGEKQRVAIARAILKRPKLFILDEATSSLDSATERAIQASLDHLAEGATTLIVAHRLSTVTNADLILVIDQGRIVERGRHAELLAKNGLYAALWRQQADARLRSPADQLLAANPPLAT